MKISKRKALELIDIKISRFQTLLDHASYNNLYDEEYNLAYYGTETLLKELFSEEEAREFRKNVSSFIIVNTSRETRLQDFKDHIVKCISQLRVYREKIQNFWEPDSFFTISVIKPKLISCWNYVKKGWKYIVALLVIIGLIADAINGWSVIKNFIDSLF